MPLGPITSDIDLSALRTLANPQRVAAGVRDGMKEVGPIVIPAMRQQMSKPEGPGAQSLTPRVIESGSAVTAQIWGNDYLRFTLIDTKAHKIVARSASALRFVVQSGAVIFRRSVQHPGTKANRWDQRGYAQVRGDVVRVLAGALIRRLGE